MPKRTFVLDLEKALQMLVTEEGRNRVAAAAVEQGFTDKPEYVTRAIQYHESREDYTKAGKLYERLGDQQNVAKSYEKAILEFERDGRFAAASEVAERLGDKKRAILYECLNDLQHGQYKPTRENHGEQKTIDPNWSDKVPFQAKKAILEAMGLWKE